MPKKTRLRRREFPKRHQRRVNGELFSLALSPVSGSSPAKFSCVVSKKIAPRAVDRNTLKRRCREVFRPLLADKKAMLVVVYPKKSALLVSYAHFSREAKALLGKMSS